MASDTDIELAQFIAQFYDDPLGFVIAAYPWDTDESIQLVKLPEPWASRYPHCKFGPDKWACELLDEIGRQVKANRFDGHNPVKPIRIAVSRGHGIGKGIDIKVKIDTPDGVRVWGDLKVGDRLWGTDGKPTRIVGIPYRGVRPFYRVTFDDGSSVDVSQEHLWTVRGRAQRRKDHAGGATGEWITMETQELAQTKIWRSNGATRTRQWEIPRYAPVEYPRAELSIDPYTMGAYLGNGCASSSRIAISDMASLAVISQRNCQGIDVRPYKDGRKCVDVCIKTLASRLATLGIKDLRSYEKYIPDCYKYASIEQRSELLRGLLDTDGTAGKRGSVTYSSTSKRLADDIVWLVRSLGGKAQIQDAIKKPWYRDDAGNKVLCRDCYNLTIRMPDGFKYGYVTHKWERVGDSQARYLTRWIDSIEPVGERECMCVTVDREDGLFLANDFIVTHNSALTAFIIDWIMSTRPYAKGTVTATTNGQLATRTWAQIKSWTSKCITSDWFQLKAGRGSMTFESKEAPSDWFASAQSCRKENSEAFAGQHAANSTSFYIFDEGSGIDAKIYEVAEGGLTDGEPMIFVFGNPTRNSGPFYDIFHKQRDLWTTFKVDSREAQITNKASIAEWERLYGEDSDFFRVRVRGEFPNASSCQLISQDIVEQAMARKTDEFHPGTRPIALVGVDLAAMGDDKTAICTRVGNEVFDIKVLTKTDIEHVCAVLKDHIDWLYKTFGFERVYVFMDRGGIGQGHVERMQYAGYNVHGINFAQTPDKPEEYKNKRSEMWGRMRDWLRDEDAVLPDDDDLKYDLTAPEYFYDNGNRLQLESKEDMKKRGISSPDKGDALALTFAQKVFQPSDSVLLHQNRAAELTKRSRLIRR